MKARNTITMKLAILTALAAGAANAGPGHRSDLMHWQETLAREGQTHADRLNAGGRTLAGNLWNNCHDPSLPETPLEQVTPCALQAYRNTLPPLRAAQAAEKAARNALKAATIHKRRNAGQLFLETRSPPERELALLQDARARRQAGTREKTHAAIALCLIQAGWPNVSEKCLR